MHHRPNPGYCFFGAEALLVRLRDMADEIEGVRKNEDIECVHRMRVASRRTRAALRLFESCFDPSDAGRWKREARRITKRLGAARDGDVQIEFLEQFLAEMDGHPGHAGVERLLLRLRQARELEQPKVIKALDRLATKGTIEAWSDILRERVVRGRMQQLEQKSDATYGRANLAISLRLEEMLTYEPYIKDTDRKVEHHNMRIAAKGLRYTLEIFDPLYNGKLKTFVKTVKRIQSLLGSLQDCEVWMRYLPVFLEDERARTQAYLGHTRPLKRIAEGIEFLRAQREAKHLEDFNLFNAFWEELKMGDRWGELRKTLQAHGEDAKQDALPPQDSPATPDVQAGFDTHSVT